MITSSATRRLMDLLGIDHPVVQAPMAGTSTPAMAAAVSNAGGLGSLGVGAMTAAQAAGTIAAFRAASARALNVNVFCHLPARPDPAREVAWLRRLRPHFERWGAHPPAKLAEIYTSFLEDDAMLDMLLATRPTVVSLHFGAPRRERIQALRDAGIVLFGTATSLAEARALIDAGVQVIVAQGYEAGGHRGVFDPDAADDRLGTLALTRLLARSFSEPIIAAGGIMDGQGIAGALQLGAAAAQLGTAFVPCTESAADAGYRAALFSDAAQHTVMTRVISGRPARCLSNRFTTLGANLTDAAVPDYPLAYDAGKALHAAAEAAGDHGYGAQWAGQGAPLARSMPAARLMEALVEEMGGANPTQTAG